MNPFGGPGLTPTLLLRRIARRSLLTLLFLGVLGALAVALFAAVNWVLPRILAKPWEEVKYEVREQYFHVAAGVRVAGRPTRIELFSFADLPDPLSADLQFQLDRDTYRYSWSGGRGSATVHLLAQDDLSQLVAIDVRGDTQWQSWSRYRVTGNQIRPISVAYLNGMALLWIYLVCLWLSYRGSRMSLRFVIDRLLAGTPFTRV